MPSISGIARSVSTTSAPCASNAARPARAAVARLDHQPRVAQHRLEREPQRRVVVDDEHAAHAAHVSARRDARIGGLARRGLGHGGRFVGARPPGLGSCGSAAARLGLHRAGRSSRSSPCRGALLKSSVPAVLLDEPARDRDAEAGAALLAS